MSHNPALLPLLASASLFATTLARADSSRPTSWWVEARPWTCVAQQDPLARAVQAACDAAGGCRIAPDERTADRRAVLVCAEDGWSVEALDAHGASLWSLALGPGDAEARLRKAGVWIARSEGPQIPAASPAPTAPSPSTSSLSDSPPADQVASTPADKALRVTLAAMAHGSATTDQGYGFGPAAGARAIAMAQAPELVGPLRLGIVGTAEQSLTGNGYSLYRVGVIAGLGAPFDSHVIGITIEAGGADLHMETSPSLGIYTPVSSPRLYGQASLYVQAPVSSAWRPFLGVSIAGVTDPGQYIMPNRFVGIDLGLAMGPL